MHLFVLIEISCVFFFLACDGLENDKENGFNDSKHIMENDESSVLLELLLTKKTSLTKKRDSHIITTTDELVFLRFASKERKYFSHWIKFSLIFLVSGEIMVNLMGFPIFPLTHSLNSLQMTKSLIKSLKS